MELNALPRYDMSDNPTHCCPRFHSKDWDGAELHFINKPFLRATTRSLFHIPINIGSVFPRVLTALQAAECMDEENFIVLSHEISAWKGEHFFSVNKPIEGEEMTTLSGDYLTRVFEGPYRHQPKWEKEMEATVHSKRMELKSHYFFYTTCPKCAKYYGKNHVVAVAEVVPIL